jgi:hypothetical protein
VEISDLPPVTGVWPPDESQDVSRIEPHQGFNNAIGEAIDRAAETWHNKGDPSISVWARVDLFARVDIYNPGGIGRYGATLTPQDPGG